MEKKQHFKGLVSLLKMLITSADGDIKTRLVDTKKTYNQENIQVGTNMWRYWTEQCSWSNSSGGKLTRGNKYHDYMRHARKVSEPGLFLSVLLSTSYKPHQSAQRSLRQRYAVV